MMSFLHRLSLIVVLALSAMAPAVALAQASGASSNTPNYAAWDQIATRAERALGTGRASSVAFEELRRDIVNWRETFSSAQNVNGEALETVNAQIKALGPADAENQASEILERRKQLEARRAELNAPRLVATEAYNRADSLIAQIDKLLRERDTAQLLKLGPSPLNPANWTKAADEVRATGNGLRAEVDAALASETQSRAIRDNAPAILLWLVAAMLLFLRVPRWISDFLTRIRRDDGTAGFRLMRNGRGIATIISRTLGAIAVAFALELTSIPGFRGQTVVDQIPILVFIVVAAMFVTPRLLMNPWAEPRRSATRRVGLWLGLSWAVHDLAEQLGKLDVYSDATLAVINFPIIVFASLNLYRLSRIIGQEAAEYAEGAEGPTTVRARAQRLAQILSATVAVVAPIAAVIGYGTLANGLIFPAILTLGLIGLLIAAAYMVLDFYGIARRKSDEEVQASLVPVIFNSAMLMASLPLFALIWGVRASQLDELWTRFTEGVSLGDTRISPGDFLTFAVVFAIGYLVTRMLQSVLRASVLPKTNLDIGGQRAIVSGLGYVGIFLAALIAITTAGLNLSSLAIVAGALSVGIGFGLQNIVSNFVSGIILLVERPIAEGDWIEVGGTHGTVRNISVRSTRIETFDRSDVIVPNADLVSGTVTNYTRGNSVGRIIVPVSVAYGTDTRKIEAMLKEIAKAHPMVLLNPEPSVLFQNFGADGLDFEIRAILRDVNFSLSTRSELNHAIAAKFQEEGIEIPYPQRDLWLRNPEVLNGTREGEI